MISRETIDRIFETARIEEVIGDFVTLKKSGGNYKGLSPFSNEKTPSFMVSPAKQIFKDFSSGKGGNVVSFLMEHEHYTYPEALKFLAEKYNIEIEETGQSEEQKALKTEKESLYLVNDFALRYFQDQLWNTEEGRNIGLSYFRERGMTDETIKEFRLGYCPESGSALTDAAIAEAYKLEFLEKTGLTKVAGERKWDRFRGRVIFPILSHTGRVLGFGGRILKQDVKAAKYLNSPESEIYHKSKTLYGIFQAKSELGREDECLLVEGYTDVTSLFQSGVKNVVASSGTSLTTEQISLVKRYTQNVTILYDGDSAGIKASLRGIDMLLAEGLNVKVLLFPDGDDPDSYARKVSTAELKGYIKDEKRDFMRFKASLLLQEAGDNPLEKSAAAREIVQSIAVISDALKRDAYVRESARLLQIDERVLFSELAQIVKNNQKQQEKKSTAKQESPRMEVVEEKPVDGSSQFYEQEKHLCWLLLNFGQETLEHEELIKNSEGVTEEDEEQEEITIGEFIITELQNDGLNFLHPIFQRILEKYLENFNESGIVLTTENLLREEDQEMMNVVVDLISEKYFLHKWEKKKIHPSSLSENITADARQSILRYKEKQISNIIRELRQTLNDEGGKREKNMKKLMRLTALRQKVNNDLGRVV